MKSNIMLFTTAAMQVALVSMNVLFITKGAIIPMLITGFLISLVWTLNVKKIAFGMWRERIIYASGAMFGTGVGYWISNLLLEIFK
jgi:hypothetical protein